MITNNSIPAAILLAGAMFLASCQTVPVGGKGGSGMAASEGGMEGLNGTGMIMGDTHVVMPQENDSALDPGDPCVNNLEILTGALLSYAAQKHRLPESLSELPTTFAGDTLSLSCPASGKPYAYYPGGLRAPPELAPKLTNSDGSPVEGNILILTDATPDHTVTRRLTNGKKDWTEKQKVRYGIVMEPPARGKAVKMYVIPVEQALLNLYLKGQRQEQQGGSGGGVRQMAPGGAF